MSFSMLPKEIKVNIFNMLSISNRYNASLVWKEMTYETWRSIPTVGEMKRKVPCKYGRIFIQNLDDLETLGVLASAGNLEILDDLYLTAIDVTNVPINIVNSLAKIVNGSLYFEEVAGLNLSMLKNLNCEILWLENLRAPAHLNQDINVNGIVHLEKVYGDISGLLERITCEGLQLDNMILNNCELRSLSKMLDRRVVNLTLCGNYLHNTEASILANYDGKGKCESISFTDNSCSSSKNKELFSPWTNSKGWNIL